MAGRGEGRERRGEEGERGSRRKGKEGGRDWKETELKGQGADTLERAGGALGSGELWGAGGGNGNYHIQAPGGRCTQRTA